MDADWRHPEDGVPLAQADCARVVDESPRSADGADSWKLERRQDYREEGCPSYDAFVAATGP